MSAIKAPHGKEEKTPTLADTTEATPGVTGGVVRPDASIDPGRITQINDEVRRILIRRKVRTANATASAHFVGGGGHRLSDDLVEKRAERHLSELRAELDQLKRASEDAAESLNRPAETREGSTSTAPGTHDAIAASRPAIQDTKVELLSRGSLPTGVPVDEPPVPPETPPPDGLGLRSLLKRMLNADPPTPQYPGPGAITKHKEWNRLRHIEHGNTSSSQAPEPTPYFVMQLFEGATEPRPVIIDLKMPTKQWEKHGGAWASWWGAIGVGDGEYKGPFEHFPASLTFGGRVVEPNYTVKAWRFMLPALSFRDESNNIVPYDGQEGVDLDSTLIWVWPEMKFMAAGLLNGIKTAGASLSEDDIAALFSRTPSIAVEVKQAIKQVKDSLIKILNRHTAKRAPGYKLVAERYSKLLRAKQAELDELRVLVRNGQAQMDQLLLDRDAELRDMDPNFKASRMSLEDQLKNFGLDSLPLAAPDAQRPPKSAEKPRPSEGGRVNFDTFFDDE